MTPGILIASAIATSLAVWLVMPVPAANPQQLPRLDSRSARNDAYGLDTPRPAGAYDPQAARDHSRHPLYRSPLPRRIASNHAGGQLARRPRAVASDSDTNT